MIHRSLEIGNLAHPTRPPEELGDSRIEGEMGQAK
jgi:hypothetical protein